MSIRIDSLDLENIEFVESDSISIFRVYDNNRTLSLDFHYKPNKSEVYDKDDYQLVLLENKNLKAENDAFQVFGEKVDIGGRSSRNRLGWVFTISNLDSLEHDHVDNVHLNKYKYVAFQLLLSKCNIKIEERKELYNISELYEEDTIIFIVCKNNFDYVDDSSIYDYFPSLSKYGYYEHNDIKSISNVDHKKELADLVRKNNKINLEKANISISENEFIYNLFTQYLKSLEHSLLRFHLLYQVVEYYIDIIFDKESDEVIKKFNSNSISKNDFFEKINLLRKERKRVNILSSSFIKNPEFVNLQENCTDLLIHCSREPSDSIGNLIYDVRNLVVHDYKMIKRTEHQKLVHIVNDFEVLVISIIESADL